MKTVEKYDAVIRQKTRLDEIFRTADVDGSGKLERTEVLAMMNDLASKTPSLRHVRADEADVEWVLEACDMDGKHAPHAPRRAMGAIGRERRRVGTGGAGVVNGTRRLAAAPPTAPLPPRPRPQMTKRPFHERSCTRPSRHGRSWRRRRRARSPLSRRRQSAAKTLALAKPTRPTQPEQRPLTKSSCRRAARAAACARCYDPCAHRAPSRQPHTPHSRSRICQLETSLPPLAHPRGAESRRQLPLSIHHSMRLACAVVYVPRCCQPFI